VVRSQPQRTKQLSDFMPFGKKRTKAEIHGIKAEILELFVQGATKADVGKVIKEKYKVPARTFDRYWISLMNQIGNELEKEKGDIVLGFVRRQQKRIQEAQIQFVETKKQGTADRLWLTSASNLEKDLIDKLMQLGIIEKAPDKFTGKMELNLKGRLLDALEEARKETEQG